MEDPILPITVLLDAVLPQLGFYSANYIDDHDESGLSKTRLYLNSNTDPDETDNDSSHVFTSDWCISIKHAHQDAASTALEYLKNKMKLEIHDFSYMIMKKMKQYNYRLSLRCQGYAEALNTILLTWSGVTYNIHEAAADYKSLIIKHRPTDTCPSTNSALDLLLNHVDGTHRSLLNIDKTNVEKIGELYHWMTPLIREFIDLDKNITHQNYNITKAVTISPTMMLSQLLADKNCPSPEYTYITKTDDKITACCIFYPCKDSTDYLEPIKMYGLLSWNITSAKEAAALRVLEYMDTDLEIKLHDYNYSDKELEIEKNRGILNKKTHFEGAVFDTHRLFHTEATELFTILDTLKVNIASVPVTDNEHLPHSAFQVVLEAVKNINKQLDAVLMKALDVLDTYNTPYITRLQY